MSSFLNLAGYRFFKFDRCHDLRNAIKSEGLARSLTGTVLMGEEGVNFSLSGQPEALEQFLDFFYRESACSPIEFRRSWSDNSPYQRFIVKVKKEIVTMGQGSFPVAEQPGQHLAPKELQRWLDEGRDFNLLDTRNHFEVQLGKFTTAQDLGVRSFRDFARKAKDLPPSYRQKPLVMYCTGGIRCEKAAVYFRDKLGFQEVYQLEGGILKYFEECGSQHYQGDCFVFDQRIGVDSQLSETSAAQCVKCRGTVQQAGPGLNQRKIIDTCEHCQSKSIA